MKILIVNLDKSIFKKDSRSLNDLKDYSHVLDKLFVITWTLKKEEPIFFENRLFIYPTNSRNRLFYIFDTYKIFKKFIKQEKVDLVSSQDPFETGLSAWLISRIFKIPLHLQAHVDFLSPYFRQESLINRLRVWLAKFLIPRAKCIRVVSQRIKKSLLKIVNCKLKIAVLPIWVNVEKIRNTPVRTDLHKKYPQFDFIILMASRFTREKNIGLAIDAMSDVVARYPKAGLIIVGGGSLKKNYELRIKNYENIKIENWTDDLVSYYKTCDLFLLTSNYEGYGMTLVEAAAAGCKIISTDVGIAGELLDKDNLFKPGDGKTLQIKVEEAIKGNIKPPKQVKVQSRKEYLEQYGLLWRNCVNF